MKQPNILNMSDILTSNVETPSKNPKITKWVPARTLPMYTLKNRLRAAWLVFTGECDAVRWDI